MQASYVMKFPQYVPRRGTRLKTQCSSQCSILYNTVTASNHVPQISNSKSHCTADHRRLYNKNEKLSYMFIRHTYLISVQHNQWERINGYSFRPCTNSPEIVRNVPHIGIDIIRAVCPTVCEIFTTQCTAHGGLGRMGSEGHRTDVTHSNVSHSGLYFLSEAL